MKTTKFLIGFALATGIALSSCHGNQTAKAKLANDVDSASYALGMSVGLDYAQGLKNIPTKMNKDAMIKGFIKGIAEDFDVGALLENIDLLLIFDEIERERKRGSES